MKMQASRSGTDGMPAHRVFYRLIVLFLIAQSLPLVAQGQQFRPNRGLPAALELSGDWYPVISASGRQNLRTNHTLARAAVSFTGSSYLRIDFDTSHVRFLSVADGGFAWRLSKDGIAGAWTLAQAVTPLVTIATNLDPKSRYIFEMVITAMPIPSPTLALDVRESVERFRDHGGLQGLFVDIAGFRVSGTATWLTMPPPLHPHMEVIIYGDSLADGFVPFNAAGAPHPFGALVSWPARAVQLALANLPTPRTPKLINHSFRGWAGCRTMYPMFGYADEATFRAQNPHAHPHISSMIDRSHPTAPTFTTNNVELVIYQLAQNDTGTGRLTVPWAYRADIIANVNQIRTAWPNAKILVCSTHLDSPLGLMQRAEMKAAMLSMGYRNDPMLHYVDTGDMLSGLGIPSQPAHPLAFIHDVWTFLGAIELYYFLK